MTLDNKIALISVVISAAFSFFGTLFAALQIREGAKQTALLGEQVRENTKQQQLQSMLEIYDMNRKLLTEGFYHPELLEVLEEEPVPHAKKRRARQLWLGLYLLVSAYLKESVFKGEMKDTLIGDLSAFMRQKQSQEYWSLNRHFYPPSFQKLVEDCIKKYKKEEPPSQTAAAQGS